MPRYYYFADKYIVKEYIFSGPNKAENSRQIVAEINTMLHLKNIHRMPEMIDFELNDERAKIVIKRVKGTLLIDTVESGDTVNVVQVVKDVLKTLSDLEDEGLYHNDVRSWNIIYDGSNATLIDYGVVSHKATDYDMVSLLWVANTIITGEREGYGTRKKELPLKKNFYNIPKLKLLYKLVASGETSPKNQYHKIFREESKKPKIQK